MPKKKTTIAKKKSASKKVAKKATKKIVEKSVKKAPAKSTVKKKPKEDAAAKESTDPKANASTKKRVPETTVAKEAADSKSTPIVFSLDDVKQVMKAKKSEAKSESNKAKKAVKKEPAAKPKPEVLVEDKPTEQRKLGAASLSDILGFNPAEKKQSRELNNEEVPKKWKKYYTLLLELRAHFRDEIDLHSSDTLKHSSREDSGDLSGYGSHQADVGTDTFDRDFALSLVSNEHEALNEIEDAIQRIKKGTYGTCEVTGKPIPAARLTAVPFARFSIEGQAEYEKNLRRKADRGTNTGLFGDASDAPKIAANDDDE